MSRSLVVSICAIMLAMAFVVVVDDQPACALTASTGSFVWDDETGTSDPDKPLTVYYYRPVELTSETPVWLIMHGQSRNADDYRDYFADAAAAQGALVIAPEFNSDDWPGSRSYNLGNLSLSESNLTARPRQQWSFSKIEPLFDYLVETLEPTLAADEYFMFGHSAGSQFTHRFLQWMPDARVKLAVAANAGWYTMPQYSDASYPHNWPYSLSGTPDLDTEAAGYQALPTEYLGNFLARDMVILLGDQDTQVTGSVRQTVEANAQGPHRFARGQFFFNEGLAEATARGMNFGWQLQFVPGVGHSGSQMAVPAAELFRLANLSPADFDQDGDVDASDLTRWADEYASATDGDDFLAWQREIADAPAAASPVQVPEPATIWLTLGFVQLWQLLAGR